MLGGELPHVLFQLFLSDVILQFNSCSGTCTHKYQQQQMSQPLPDHMFFFVLYEWLFIWIFIQNTNKQIMKKKPLNTPFKTPRGFEPIKVQLYIILISNAVCSKTFQTQKSLSFSIAYALGTGAENRPILIKMHSMFRYKPGCPGCRHHFTIHIM